MEEVLNISGHEVAMDAKETILGEESESGDSNRSKNGGKS
jgi:hypothetical protein